MTIQYHWNNSTIKAGITLKNDKYAEDNNMGLHVSNMPEVVVTNRERLAKMLGLPLTQFVCAEQTHSDQFYKVTAADMGRGALSMSDAILATDALYTFEKEIVLCSFTADCVPLTFYDDNSQLIGVIHSGWQGSVKEIAKKLFEHLIDTEKINPENLHVHLGPCISQNRFEVDADVMRKFSDLGYAQDYIEYKAETKKYHIDNQAVVTAQCQSVGIPLSQISVDQQCTFDGQAHFSHRQDRETGRHLSFIVRR